MRLVLTLALLASCCCPTFSFAAEDSAASLMAPKKLKKKIWRC